MKKVRSCFTRNAGGDSEGLFSSELFTSVDACGIYGAMQI